MSETRAAYNVTLLDEILSPGPKLDVLVTSITDVEGSPSTDPAAAMDAWEWLEEHNPWKPDYLALMRYDDKPSVCRVYYQIDELVTGETYAHAIALAVVKAWKVMEKHKS